VKESTVEEYLRVEVQKAGGRCEKVVDLTRIGCPDREVQWPQPLLCAGIDKVELKKPGKEPEPHQVRYHEYLASCGVPVYVIDTKAKVDAYIAARLDGIAPLWLFSVPVYITV
jgi:hypothetical protein